MEETRIFEFSRAMFHESLILDGFTFESIWNVASSLSLATQNRSPPLSNVQVKVLQPICSLPGKNSSLPLQFPLNSEKKFFCNSPRLRHSPTPSSHFLRLDLFFVPDYCFPHPSVFLFSLPLILFYFFLFIFNPMQYLTFLFSFFFFQTEPVNTRF